MNAAPNGMVGTIGAPVTIEFGVRFLVVSITIDGTLGFAVSQSSAPRM